MGGERSGAQAKDRSAQGTHRQAAPPRDDDGAGVDRAAGADGVREHPEEYVAIDE